MQIHTLVEKPRSVLCLCTGLELHTTKYRHSGSDCQTECFFVLIHLNSGDKVIYFILQFGVYLHLYINPVMITPSLKEMPLSRSEGMVCRMSNSWQKMRFIQNIVWEEADEHYCLVGVFRLKVTSACFTGEEFPRGKAGEDPQDYLLQKGSPLECDSRIVKARTWDHRPYLKV